MFRKVISGYDTVEVDKQFAELRRKYEERLSEQKERIFNLLEENKQLSSKLSVYETKEQAIIEAEISSRTNAKILTDKANNQVEQLINQAISKSKQLISLGLSQYEKAKSRTDIFIACCQMYISKLMGVLNEQQLKEFGVLYNKLVLINCAESTNTIPVCNNMAEDVISAATNSLTQPKQQIAHKLNFEDFYNVTQSLEQLCKELGIE